MSQLSQDSLLLARSGLGEGLRKGFQPHMESEDSHLVVLTWPLSSEQHVWQKESL